MVFLIICILQARSPPHYGLSIKSCSSTLAWRTSTPLTAVLALPGSCDVTNLQLQLGTSACIKQPKTDHFHWVTAYFLNW